MLEKWEPIGLFDKTQCLNLQFLFEDIHQTSSGPGVGLLQRVVCRKISDDIIANWRYH